MILPHATFQESTVHPSTSISLLGGTLYDPANGKNGVVCDIHIRDGRIVDALHETPSRTLDLSGLIVMPGGVDIHSHVAGPKVCSGRRIAPDLANNRPAAVPTAKATGSLYAALGYTTVFDAAVSPSAAHLVHIELADLPILDKGIYLLVADEQRVIDSLERRNRRETMAAISQSLAACRGWAVKVANPGGCVFWKRGLRGDHHDLDSTLPGYSISPRDILRQLAEAIVELGLPHPLHVHTANLGLPGNWRTTMETLRTFDGLRAHLAHVQFHSYTGGDCDSDTFGSGVEPLAHWFNEHSELTLDVGQILFGRTVAMTGDSSAAEHLAHTTGVPWRSHDEYLEGGCGILPIEYREKNLIHSWQWAIGLEWFLSVSDPWRIALTTDHPNGAHFTAYPHLMRLLGDAAFRRAAVERIHPLVRSRSPLGSLSREYSLSELCIITRAAPARIAGLKTKGHLGPGADADVTVYRRDADLERMFSLPAFVLKAGTLVVEDGHVRSYPVGQTFACLPECS